MDKDEVISTLNDLIETCKDGEYGFRSCAEHADSSELLAFLEEADIPPSGHHALKVDSSSVRTNLN